MPEFQRECGQLGLAFPILGTSYSPIAKFRILLDPSEQNLIILMRGPMLSKCANPSCSIPFRYLHEGKLFRIYTPKEADHSSSIEPSRIDSVCKKPVRQVEFFWLCQDCSTKMTLIFEEEAGIQIRTLECLRAAAS